MKFKMTNKANMFLNCRHPNSVQILTPNPHQFCMETQPCNAGDGMRSRRSHPINIGDMTTMLPCIGSCDWETQWRMYFVDPNLGNWSTHSTHPPEGAGSSRGAVLGHHYGGEVRALMLSAKQVVSGSHFKSAVWPGWGKPTTSQH